MQEPKLKQPLICYSKSPSEKVVAVLQEESDMGEMKMREGSRSMSVVLIAVREKHK